MEVSIRVFREADLDAVLEIALRPWERIFESARQMLG